MDENAMHDTPYGRLGRAFGEAAKAERRHAVISPSPDIESRPVEWSSEDAADAFDLADDPIWGDLYRDLIRDRYAQFYKVIAHHRPAIEAALRRDRAALGEPNA